MDRQPFYKADQIMYLALALADVKRESEEWRRRSGHSMEQWLTRDAEYQEEVAKRDEEIIKLHGDIDLLNAEMEKRDRQADATIDALSDLAEHVGMRKEDITPDNASELSDKLANKITRLVGATVLRAQVATYLGFIPTDLHEDDLGPAILERLNIWRGIVTESEEFQTGGI